MRSLLLAGLLVAPAVQAQVVHCPAFYPATETMLAEVPPQRKGQGFIAQQPLTGAGLTVGEINGGGDIQGARKAAKGGYEIRFGSWKGPKWMVCTYGDHVTTWWERLDTNEADCRLKVVTKNANGSMSATLTCK